MLFLTRVVVQATRKQPGPETRLGSRHEERYVSASANTSWHGGPSRPIFRAIFGLEGSRRMVKSQCPVFALLETRFPEQEAPNSVQPVAPCIAAPGA